jgi:very-short-patch-repair endonuclease
MRRKLVLSGRPGNWGVLQERAWQMRENPTPAEKALWERIRRNALGQKFRPQHVIDRYIVDFFCFSARLVVEIDGPIHEGQLEDDRNRDAVLQNLGYRVIRYTNNQVLSEIDEVLENLVTHLGKK